MHLLDFVHPRTWLFSTYFVLLLFKSYPVEAQASSNDSPSAAQIVCAPSIGCLQGQVDSRGMFGNSPHPSSVADFGLIGVGAVVTLPPSNSSTSSSSAILLPGSYTLPFSGNPEVNDYLSSPSNASPTSFTGFSTSTTSADIAVVQASGLLVYSDTFFSGSSSLLAFNNSFLQRLPQVVDLKDW
ncbi:MAG: hypothetical protein CYPHOPRED_000285 [Cyphobasidiales sp. Tagirdzhanova-0007]|nr:MAG: hypothetical protein CYPHOPRED_000285 [Cyphobasidiales sp. Tagirdzhanova-0007]